MSQIYVPFTSSSPIPPNIPTSFVTNSGTSIPALNIINLLTANSTPEFQGSGNTITLDFGLSNLVLGSSSPNITSGNSNVGFGQGSLGLLTTGSDNTAVGWASGASLTTGTNNTLVGLAAGGNLTTTNGTVAIGVSALQDATGQHNTSVGYNSLADVTTGTENIALGYQAGLAYKSSESSNIIIGNAGQLNDQNTIRIGVNGVGSGQQSTCYIAGIAGVSVSNLQVVTINTTTGQLGSQVAVAATSIIGTANQVLANGTSGAAQTGAVTLTTPQDIATTSDVTFNRVFGPAGTSAAPTYSFTGFTDTGVFRNNNDLILVGGGFATVAAGFNVLLSGGITTISQGVVFSAISTQTGNFTTNYNTFLWLVDVTTGSAAITVQLVSDPIPGQIYVIKDSTGAAATFNITISGTVSAKLIDGAATLVININYGVARLIYSGVQWIQI